jgi:hypothetical protein
VKEEKDLNDEGWMDGGWGVCMGREGSGNGDLEMSLDLWMIL